MKTPTEKTLNELYETMFTIRLLEDRLQAMCDRGEAGDLHFNKGQEAVSVGVCATLRPQDHIVTHHRTIAHQVARGANLYSLVAELLGRRTGTNGGRAGEMHISDPAIRHDFSFQLVGTCIPVAAGLAWALKNHLQRDEIVATFFGDAASSNGQFHEGLSLMAIHKLPVLLICENNHLAGNIRPQHYMPTPSIPYRVDGYRIPTIQADGNDIEEVMRTTRTALDIMKNDGGPCFIDFDTTRLCWHKQGQRDVRTAVELAKEAERDPIAALERKIFNLEWKTEDNQILRRINQQLDDAFEQALADPPPEVFHD